MTKTLETCRCGNCTPTKPTSGKRVTVAEAVAAVDAACEKVEHVMEKVTVAEQSDPFEGHTVVAECLTPRSPDGKSGGEVVPLPSAGRAPQEYAMPIAHMKNCASADHLDWNLAAKNDERRGVQGDVSEPTSEAELALAKLRLKQLDAIIDNPATDVTTRVSAQIERSQVLEAIEAIEAALRPQMRIGKAPTAGAQHYAPTVPYWNEPRVSDSKKAELEAEAAGLRTQLQSPDLTPSQKIRLEQALTHIERILGKTGTGDAVSPQDR